MLFLVRTSNYIILNQNNYFFYFLEQEILQVGAILVNNLSDLTALTGYKTYSPAEIKSRQTSKYRLSLGSDSKVFQLAKVDETARVMKLNS